MDYSESPEHDPLKNSHKLTFQNEAKTIDDVKMINEIGVQQALEWTLHKMFKGQTNTDLDFPWHFVPFQYDLTRHCSFTMGYLFNIYTPAYYDLTQHCSFTLGYVRLVIIDDDSVGFII